MRLVPALSLLCEETRDNCWRSGPFDAPIRRHPTTLRNGHWDWQQPPLRPRPRPRPRPLRGSRLGPAAGPIPQSCGSHRNGDCAIVELSRKSWPHPGFGIEKQTLTKLHKSTAKGAHTSQNKSPYIDCNCNIRKQVGCEHRCQRRLRHEIRMRMLLDFKTPVQQPLENWASPRSKKILERLAGVRLRKFDRVEVNSIQQLRPQVSEPYLQKWRTVVESSTGNVPRARSMKTTIP